MDEEKLTNAAEEAEEAAEEAITEATEEIKEAAAEAAEDTADEAAEAVSEAVEEAEEAASEAEEEAEQTAEKAGDAIEGEDAQNPIGYSEEEATGVKKTVSKGAIAAIVAIAVIVIAAIVLLDIFVIRGSKKNKYEKDYLDITNQTAGEIADLSGMEYEDFLAYYDLPSDLPKDTNANATEYTIPAGRYAELTGSTFEEVKELLGWDDSITEDTTWGEALDSTKLAYYVGEEQLDRFKTMYELDDSVTGETTWGEIRHQYELKQRELYEEQQAASEETGADADTDADTEADSSEEAAATTDGE